MRKCGGPPFARAYVAVSGVSGNPSELSEPLGSEPSSAVDNSASSAARGTAFVGPPWTTRLLQPQAHAPADGKGICATASCPWFDDSGRAPLDEAHSGNPSPSSGSLHVPSSKPKNKRLGLSLSIAMLGLWLPGFPAFPNDSAPNSPSMTLPMPLLPPSRSHWMAVAALRLPRVQRQQPQDNNKQR